MSSLPHTVTESVTPFSASQNAGSSVMVFGVLLVSVAVLYFGRDVFVPFALATLLSFMLAPLVIRLRRLGVPRVVSIILVVALAFSVIAGLGIVVTNQIASLADDIPRYERNIEAKVKSLQDLLPRGAMLNRASEMLKDPSGKGATAVGPVAGGPVAGSVAASAEPQPVTVRIADETMPLEVLTSLIAPVIGPFGTAGLALVFLVLILFEREDLRDRLIRLAGGDLHRATQALNDAALRVSRYLLMQLIINATYGLAVGIGLFFIGVPNPVLWGLLATLLRFVPYAGPFIAAAFPIALSLAVDPGWTMPLLTIGLFLLAELVSNNVMEPWLYGSSTGLSAVAVIAAAVFWTALWGPVGLILSTPLTVCLVVLGRHVPQLQFLGVMLGNQPVLPTGARFYQRILAHDPDEATELAGRFVKEHSIVALCDEVILPALALAEQDRQRGALDEDRQRLIAEAIPEVLEDLLEQEDGTPADRGALSSGGAVLCLAGRTPLDEAAARLLAYMLEHHDIPARAMPAEASAIGRLGELGIEQASLVCTTFLHSSPLMHARHLCKRLRRHSGGHVKILAGLWNVASEEKAHRDTLSTTTADIAVTTFREALEHARDVVAAEITSPMEPAPVAPNEQERVDELKRFDLLDTEPEEAFDRVTRELAKIFKTPISLMSLIDEARQFWKSAVGLPADLAACRQSDRATSICGHVVASNDVLVIEDVRKDRRFANNPFLKEQGIRFYAGAPLTSRTGHAIGSICVLDKRPRKLTAQEIGLLRLVADGVMTEVELRAMSKDAALMTRRMEQWDQARRHDLQLARAVQRFLLPPEQHAGSTYLLCHGYRPRADRGADFADVHVAPDGGAALLLADLCGEGPSAALFAVVLKSAFARAAQRELEPASILTALNEELGVMAQPTDQITALVAVFDPGTQTLAMAAAGHPAPLALRGTKARQVELQSGPPLMVERDARFRCQKVDLAYGDRMIFYTDGAVEVAVAGGGLLGPTGLSRLAEECADQHGKSFVEAVLAALGEAAGHDLDDDVALLVLECVPGPAVTTSDREGLAAESAAETADASAA